MFEAGFTQSKHRKVPLNDPKEKIIQCQNWKKENISLTTGLRRKFGEKNEHKISNLVN
jgi:hypothetical protein